MTENMGVPPYRRRRIRLLDLASVRLEGGRAPVTFVASPWRTTVLIGASYFSSRPRERHDADDPSLHAFYFFDGEIPSGVMEDFAGYWFAAFPLVAGRRGG